MERVRGVGMGARIGGDWRRVQTMANDESMEQQQLAASQLLPGEIDPLHKATDVNTELAASQLLPGEIDPLHKSTDVNTEPTTRRKIIHTIVVYMAGFDLAFSSSMIGPCLMDLELLTSSDTATIGMVFTGRGFGSLAGNILASVLFSKINSWFLLFLTKLLSAVLTVLIPMCHNVPLLITCSVPAGLMDGLIDAGCCAMIVMIWGSDNGPWMQAYIFLYSIGCMIAPLVAGPFLYAPSYKNPSIDTMVKMNSSMLANVSSDDIGNDLINTTVRDTRELEEQPSRIWLAFLIAAILAMTTCLASLVALITSDRRIVTTSRQASPKIAPNCKTKFRFLPGVCFHGLIFLVALVVVGIDSCVGYYVMIFSVDFFGWTKSKGALVTFAFYCAFVVGCGVGILGITLVRPIVLLMADLCVCVIFSGILAVCVKMHELVLWVCIAGIGFGVSSIFATLFTWTETYIGVNARVSGIILAGSGVGDMAIPALTGLLLDKVHTVAFVYVVFILTACGLLMMCLLLWVARTSKLGNKDVNYDRDRKTSDPSVPQC